MALSAFFVSCARPFRANYKDTGARKGVKKRYKQCQRSAKNTRKTVKNAWFVCKAATIPTRTTTMHVFYPYSSYKRGHGNRCTHLLHRIRCAHFLTGVIERPLCRIPLRMPRFPKPQIHVDSLKGTLKPGTSKNRFSSCRLSEN